MRDYTFVISRWWFAQRVTIGQYWCNEVLERAQWWQCGRSISCWRFRSCPRAEEFECKLISSGSALPKSGPYHWSSHTSFWHLGNTLLIFIYDNERVWLRLYALGHDKVFRAVCDRHGRRRTKVSGTRTRSANFQWGVQNSLSESSHRRIVINHSVWKRGRKLLSKELFMCHFAATAGNYPCLGKALNTVSRPMK